MIINRNTVMDLLNEGNKSKQQDPKVQTQPPLSPKVNDKETYIQLQPQPISHISNEPQKKITLDDNVIEMQPDTLDTSHNVQSTPVIPNLSDEEAKFIYQTSDNEMSHRIKQEQQPVLKQDILEMDKTPITFNLPHNTKGQKYCIPEEPEIIGS